jgi:hypothetical protein
MQNGLSVTSKQQDQKTFYAMDFNNKFGFYAQYEDSKDLGLGAYSIWSFSNFKWTNFMHIGKNINTPGALNLESKNHFFEMISQVSRSFDLGSFKISPKFSAGYQKLFDLEGTLTQDTRTFNIESGNSGAFLSELGLDATSKFTIKSIPFEAFASFEMTGSTGHDLALSFGAQRFTQDSNLSTSASFGIKATLNAFSNVYANTTITQMDKAFELGVNARI